MKTRLLGVLLACAAFAGCSDGAVAPGAVATEPAATATSDSGTFTVSVHSAPDAVPTRGVNTLQLVVARAIDGSRAGGLDLDVVPWMPAMGHGASVKPSVHAEAEVGVYTVTNVNLFMPGLWEIRTTIGGSDGDHVTASFEIH